MLKTIKELILKNKKFKHDSLMQLYEACVNYNEIKDSAKGQEHIEDKLKLWSDELLSS